MGTAQERRIVCRRFDDLFGDAIDLPVKSFLQFLDLEKTVAISREKRRTETLVLRALH